MATTSKQAGTTSSSRRSRQPAEKPTTTTGSARHRTAFSYLRVSSVKQAGDDRTGLDRQGDAFLPFCQRHGLIPSLDPVVDRGISAFSGKHRRKGALAAFLEAARNGTVPAGSVLVVEDLDRFSREAPSYAEETLLQVFNLGLAIGIVRDDVVVDRATYDREIGIRLQLLVRRDAAHDYSAKLSQRVSAANAKKREQARDGKLINPNRYRPHWLNYDAASGTFQENQHQAAACRRAVELAIAGYGSLRASQVLNAEGFVNAEGNRWTDATVSKTWRDRRLIGEREQLDDASGETQVLKGYFPAIITLEEWNQMRQQVDRRYVDRGKVGRGERRRNILQGVVFCPCGLPLIYQKQTSKSGKEYFYLYCLSSMKSHGQQAVRCNARAIAYDEEELLAFFMQGHWAKYFDRPADGERRRQLERQVLDAQTLLGKQRDHQQRAVSNLTSLLGSGLDADTAALLGKAATDARLQADATEAKLQELQGQLQQAGTQPDGAAMEKLIHERVAAFMAADRHDFAERIRFNTWLQSTGITVLLYHDRFSGLTMDHTIWDMQQFGMDQQSIENRRKQIQARMVGKGEKIREKPKPRTFRPFPKDWRPGMPHPFTGMPIIWPT